jgi:hypothetical protein
MQVLVTKGWKLIGAQAEMFEFFMDPNVVRSGKFSGSLKSIPVNDGNAGASAWQIIRADDYRGKRLRYTGWLKTENVTSLAALAMNVKTDTGWPVAFDNM